MAQSSPFDLQSACFALTHNIQARRLRPSLFAPNQVVTKLMVHLFDVHSAALKRNFAVYVVVARGDNETLLYVGKTGDNREGCNPIISRCGNHFSYNKIHSQVRNKIEVHENWHYTYVFDHFDQYPDDPVVREVCVDKINEMERWLNSKIQELVGKRAGVRLLNPYHGTGYRSKSEQERRNSYRTEDAESKLIEIVAEVDRMLANDAIGSRGNSALV